MAFVTDQRAHGARFRALTIIDVFIKKALAIEVGERLGGDHVVAALNRLAAQRKAPQYLFVDNGSEFAGRLLDLWAPLLKRAFTNPRLRAMLSDGEIHVSTTPQSIAELKVISKHDAYAAGRWLRFEFTSYFIVESGRIVAHRRTDRNEIRRYHLAAY